jgi:general secretion pathway protein G
MVRHEYKSARGFTLVELMIVIFMIGILMSIAIPKWQIAVRRARETVLMQDLKTLRDVIDQYTQDKHAAPQSLEDLVSAGYLRELPVDPITRSKDTWQPVMDETLSSIDQNEPGINDVRSGAQGSTLDGTPYGEL